MKASYLWIRDYLPGYRSTAAKMAEQLTFSGTEIESVTPAGGDHVLEAGVTSNRVDCLGHLGLAREVAAVSGKPLAPPPIEADARGGPTSEAARVVVEDPTCCPRYTARVIEGVKVGPSPKWLQDRLTAIGVRTVNNVVDVTNFILFELNQPLHAFDLDRLAGATVVVRRARAGERLTALNGQECRLDPEDLVIADRDQAIGIAGVMGGQDSEVTERTTRILIESAYFAPGSIRATSRRHGIRSDSAHRFERGIDRTGALAASERAARLILETGGGVLRRDPVDAGGAGPETEAIPLRLAQIKAVAGVPVPRRRAAGFLVALGCRVLETADGFAVVPPSFRGDLRREIDLVEEIVRLNGLDRVPLETRMLVRAPHEPPERTLREDVKDRMAALGFMETVTPDFIADGAGAGAAFLVSGAALKVRNPVRAGEGILRRSLLPSLLQVRKHNADHGNEDLRLFEVATVHAAAADPAALPEHVPVLGWLLDGDYREARGAAEEVLRHCGVVGVFTAADIPNLDPALRAEIRIDGARVGVIGAPALALLKEAGLKSRPVCGEIDLGALFARRAPARSFHVLPRFPAVVRDLAVIVGEATVFGALEAEIRSLEPADLEDFTLFEEYRGSQVGEGRKSLNLRFVFRSPGGTLTAEAVDRAMTAIMERLTSALAAQVRRT